MSFRPRESSASTGAPSLMNAFASLHTARSATSTGWDGKVNFMYGLRFRYTNTYAPVATAMLAAPRSAGKRGSL